MRHNVVNRTFCLDYIGEYCDRNEVHVPLRIRDIILVEASLLMVNYLDKGRSVESIPRTQLEDAAYMAVSDAVQTYAFA